MISRAASTLAICMAAYHLMSTQAVLFSHIPFLNIHLAFGLGVVFLQAAERGGKARPVFLLALLLGLLAAAYIHVEADELVDREGFPNAVDTAVGTVLVILVVAGTYESFGPVLPSLAAVGIVYAFLGPYFPEPFFHGGIEPVRLVAMLTTDLSGIYGTLLFISASYLALFLVLGSSIEHSGAVRFFIDMPLALFRNVKGGGAYAAVVASALCGMGSGSPTANVVTTGTFTIPLMKRQGLAPQAAGGVEAAASTGGQIMPPVMGAVAFVMAEFTGVSYLTICGYAIIPAILYFSAVGFSVHFHVRSSNLRDAPAEGLPPLRTFLWDLKYLLPIVVLVGVLVAGYTPGMAAFWAIISLILVSMPRRPGAAYLRTIARCLDDGGRRAAEFALVMACISIFVKIATATGIAIKFPLLLSDLSGGSLLWSYVLTAFALAVLGMELPTVPAYIIVAVVAVPALVRLGANPIQAHFFALYFSVLSALTPPVALASLAAARVAGADYFKTAWWSIKFGYLAFIVPFLFAYNPALMALGTPAQVLSAAAGALLGCFAIAACLQGHYLHVASLLDRVLLGAAAFFFLAFAVKPGIAFLAGAMALALFVTAKQARWRARFNPRYTEPPGRAFNGSTNRE
ncbi:MAG: TRAP transporter fused permease subunit [Candidatus Tectomicrobia bacterium]|nr:TRAP transporter fused permease subunit [Candidatus Tectomicrobia bacterium]